MAIVEVEDGLFLPVFQPVVAGDPAVVLVDLAVALLPVVELALRDAQPGEKLAGRDLGPLRPVVGRNRRSGRGCRGEPSVLQSSPSSFFLADVLLHQLGDDLVLALNLVSQSGNGLRVVTIIDGGLIKIIDARLYGLCWSRWLLLCRVVINLWRSELVEPHS